MQKIFNWSTDPYNKALILTSITYPSNTKVSDDRRITNVDLGVIAIRGYTLVGPQHQAYIFLSSMNLNFINLQHISDKTEMKCKYIFNSQTLSVGHKSNSLYI